MKPDIPPFPHTVIRASAGTGKTFRLANRFIGLLADGRSAERVLAATFARKAAGEILDRVLVRIAQAAFDANDCAELAAQIGRPQLDQAACRRLLQACLARLHCLRIGTLDSFFIQIAGHYGPELGLPLGWSIVDELADKSLRAAAIQAVIHGQETAEVVTLMNLLSKGEATRSVGEELHEIVQTLYGLTLDAPAEAWDSVRRLTRLPEHELAAALESLAALEFPEGRLANAHAASLAAAQQRDWASFLKGGFAAKIAAGDMTYHRQELDPGLIQVYQPVVDEAQAVLVNRLADQNEATRRLLEKFDREFRRLKLSRGVLRFEDVTRELAAAMSDGRLSGVAFRLDAHVEHLLLDEFQDTSMQQWSVVRPFAEHATAQDGAGSFFCVGDVKQAIYGWRGGVSEIFDAIREHLPEVTEESLARSYRSSPVIIAAVNQVFDALATNQALADFGTVVRRWANRFETHTTERETYPGYVQLVAGPLAEAGEKQPHTTIRFAAGEIARLAAAHPGRTIGVLVRKNATVARLMYELRAVHKLAASEEGGNPLTDSPAVQVVLSLLKLVDHPRDGIARFHVAHTPLGPAVGIRDFRDERQAMDAARRLRETLLTQGYGRTIYEWLPALAPWCDARELGRLQQLVELAHVYDREISLRTDGFADFVAARRVEDPSSAPIRVMTVHQSKGLQFDIVVLPELDARLKGMTPDVVVDRRRHIDPIERVCRYADSTLQSFLPEDLREVFQRWPDQAVDEALCVLYVALTRAVHALHLIVAPTKPDKHGQTQLKFPGTYSGVLRAAWTPQAIAVPGVLYEAGDPQWHSHAGADVPPADAIPAAESLDVALRPPAERQRGWERKSPSGMEGGDRILLADRLRRRNVPAMERGSLMHAWFEQILWLDEGEPSDEALDVAAHRLGRLSIDVAGMRQQFREFLKTPNVIRALSRRGYAALAQVGWCEAVVRELSQRPITWEVQRERPFLVRDGGTLLEGAIDRLVLLQRDGRTIAADIVDFKTDHLPNTEAVERATEFYRPQLEAYRRAVMQLTGLSAEQVTARLLFVACDALKIV